MKAAKENGIRGKNFTTKLRKIDANGFTFDSGHISEGRNHNATKEDARNFIEPAVASCKRFNGKYLCYFSSDGAAYIAVKEKLIRTAFGRDEYDECTLTFIKEIEKI